MEKHMMERRYEGSSDVCKDDWLNVERAEGS